MGTRPNEPIAVKRRTPWPLVLLAVGLCAAAAIIAYPGVAKSMRERAAASCMENLPRLYKTICLYQADNAGMLPLENAGYIEYWRVAPTGMAPTGNPFAKYDSKLETTKCPQDGHFYTTRFAVSMRTSGDETTKPMEVRVIDPEPSSVLAECHGHLDRGYSHRFFGTAWTYAGTVDGREGFHQVLRADGSTGRVDASAVRQVLWNRSGSKEWWSDGPPRTDRGSPWEVFPGETWPPKWALRFRP